MSIETAYAEGYHYAVSLNLQQRGSKLSSTVRHAYQHTDRYFYDKIAPTEAVDVVGRHGDTPLVATEYDRRAITLITSDWGDLIDRDDQLRMLHDPTSAYALNAAYALGRKKDQRIIAAAFGDAETGKMGDMLVPLPQSQYIPVDYSEETAAASGLTVDKLRYARQLLNDADVDDDEDQFCVVSASQITDLLRTTEVTSEDYNTVKALVDGKVNTFLGFHFKRVSSQLLPLDGDGHRRVLCYARSGLLLATAEDIKVDISPRKDKRMATQVYASLSCGASRMEEKKVVCIASLES